jgi:hypothetical protein
MNLSPVQIVDLLEPAESVRKAITEALLHNDHIYIEVPPAQRRRIVRTKLLGALADLERLIGNVEALRRAP